MPQNSLALLREVRNVIGDLRREGVTDSVLEPEYIDDLLVRLDEATAVEEVRNRIYVTNKYGSRLYALSTVRSLTSQYTLAGDSFTNRSLFIVQSVQPLHNTMSLRKGGTVYKGVSPDDFIPVE